MWFWIRHLSFAAVLIALAVYFLLSDGSLFDIKKSKNAAAEGLSRFYSSIRNQVKSNKERDQFVLETCFNLKIPVMCSMGGGYSSDINIIINAHANTFRLAQEIYF